MMKVREMLERWSLESGQRERRHRLVLMLDEVTLARLQALGELYPGHAPEAIAGDLLNEALSELEAAFPYVPGSRVLREDEYGDPEYEDIGPTPQFLKLVAHKLEALRKTRSNSSSPETLDSVNPPQ